MSGWGTGALSIDALSQACMRTSLRNLEQFKNLDWSKFKKGEAGVLLPLVNINDTPAILFTKRSSKLQRHADQISFPGGMIDKKVDANLFETALREFKEEVGCHDSKMAVRNLGALGTFPNRPYHFRVGAFVGLIEGNFVAPSFYPASRNEVDKILPIELAKLQNPQLKLISKDWPLFPEYHTISIDGRTECRIWGMTAWILRDFLDNLKQ